MPKVYIPNRGAHNYSDAIHFGELVYITDGLINPMSTGFIFRKLADHLKDSKPEDYLLISGLPIMNIMAAAILGRMHGVLNLLVFHYGKYVKRTFVLDDLIMAIRDLDEILKAEGETE